METGDIILIRAVGWELGASVAGAWHWARLVFVKL